ncbi:MAG: BREX-6 system BrxE protein [Candidatus Paceibacterota bacterium]
MSVVESREPSREGAPVPLSEIDLLLTAQLAIGWAGERGEDRRLGWWRTDLVSKFGGQDLFSRLLPHSWEWAIFQGVREAARRRDEELRKQDHDSDRIISLFNITFEIEERADERLADLKRTGKPPVEALPGLAEVVSEEWAKDRFAEWLQAHGKVDFVSAPIGRRIRGNAPDSLDLLVRHLIAACSPLTDEYPMPHYRRSS